MSHSLEIRPFFRVPPMHGVNNVIYFFRWRQFDTVPLYSLVNERTRDHLYTTNPWERNQAVRHWGYHSKGVAGYVFVDQWCGGVPLFCLYCPYKLNHFYTTSWAEKKRALKDGYKDEGIVGYIYRK